MIVRRIQLRPLAWHLSEPFAAAPPWRRPTDPPETDSGLVTLLTECQHHSVTNQTCQVEGHHRAISQDEGKTVHS